MSRAFFAAIFLLTACSDDTTQAPDANDVGADFARDDAGEDDETPPSTSCASISTLRVCDGACVETACRGDEVCQIDTCIPWESAELTVDFELTVADHTASVLVAPDGFPRAHVESLRFDFGDGFAGWGEDLSHEYAQPGVYLVSLEVRMTDFRRLVVKKLAVINPQEFNPLGLTVNQIPDFLNGSAPATSDNGTTDVGDDVQVPFHLAVVKDHFDIDVTLLEDPEDPIDRATLKLTATDASTAHDLTAALSFSADGIAARVSVDETTNIAAGPVTLTLEATTTAGEVHRRVLELEARNLPNSRAPFDRPLVWLFRDDIDLFSTARTQLSGSQFSIDSTAAPDGNADFAAELRQMGAQGNDDALNLIYYTWVKDAVTREVYRIFGMGSDGTPHDAIAFKIVWSGDADAPAPATFDPAGEFSMMRLGGTFEGALGYSYYQAFNEERVDDTSIDYGIATGGILNAFTGLPGISDAFKATNIDVGTPVGESEFDAIVLGPDFDPWSPNATPDAVERYFALREVARNIALGLAPVIAHEMGHAMGLMPNGLPPEGFFGDRPDITFVGTRTNSHHTDFPGLNLMQAGGNSVALLAELEAVIERPALPLIDLAAILSLETRMSPLSRAYLQGKLTYGPAD